MYSIFKSLEKYFEFPWSPESPVLLGFIMITIIITMYNMILAINNTTIIRLTHRVALQPGLHDWAPQGETSSLPVGSELGGGWEGTGSKIKFLITNMKQTLKFSIAQCTIGKPN